MVSKTTYYYRLQKYHDHLLYMISKQKLPLIEEKSI